MLLKWLSDPRRLPLLVLIGMALTLPALNAGLMLDDFIHWSLLTGQSHGAKPGSPWGLFNFFDGHDDKISSMKATGQVMWWAADDVRLSFWRPMAEWTHWLDYRLWPQSPVLMHLHSTLWYGLLIWLLGRLYRQLSPSNSTQAGLATLVFALSSLHLTPVTWLAARNQLIAGCFTVLAIGAFHQWRSTASSRQGWLAAAWLTLALLSAEAAVGTVGYLAAYCLAYAPSQTWARRLKPVLPFVAIVVVWRLVYMWLGYGTTDSAFYIDPGAAPVRFADAMLLRLPALALAALFGIPSASINNLLPQAQVLYAAGAALVVALFMLAAHAYGLWKTQLARFLALGALFAMVPMCASEPNDRLLLNAEIGTSALCAMLLIGMVQKTRTRKLAWLPPRDWLAQGGRLLVGLSLFMHFVLFPVQTLAYAALKKRIMSPAMIDEPLSLPDAQFSPDERVVLLNPPVAPLVYFYPLVRQYFGVHNPASLHALANGIQDLSVTMVDASTLKISGGPKGFMDSMGRDISLHPIKAGDVLHSGAFDVTVTEVSPQGVPLAALFHFSKPLHDPMWRFYLWTDKGFVPFKLPIPGESVTLPALDIGKTLMRRLKTA